MQWLLNNKITENEGIAMNVMFNRKKMIFSIGVVLISILGLFVFLYLNHNYSFAIPCFFHEITGLYCPGCGITRMCLSILEFDFYQAFRFNPFLFLLSPFIIGYGISVYYHWVTDTKSKPISNFIWNGLLIFAILYTVARNIPAFSYLAPTILS